MGQTTYQGKGALDSWKLSFMPGLIHLVLDSGEVGEGGHVGECPGAFKLQGVPPAVYWLLGLEEDIGCQGPR